MQLNNSKRLSDDEHVSRPAYLWPGDVTAVEGENSEAAERLNVSRDVSRQPQPVVTERQEKFRQHTHAHTHTHTRTHTHTWAAGSPGDPAADWQQTRPPSSTAEFCSGPNTSRLSAAVKETLSEQTHNSSIKQPDTVTEVPLRLSWTFLPLDRINSSAGH